ncbi:Ankyrin repeat domain-containing protein 50 [Trichoderma lentiforme]|uniref:Ankyrin repeat domain-containing protein 50 n=1 Tax=Trichoderma lentiforme TaxID=1567552 RepID=A0A9P4X5Y7_9HYPO|nr:Ankyrin repeat domain-containing protein 50 [Trichoderma lentiforme]
MDPSSIASAACSLLGMTIHISGSLYGEWDYSSQLLAERLTYELSQLRNVLQSLELTALSATHAVIVPKSLLIGFNDVKECLVSLGSEILGPNVSNFKDYELPWRSFNAPRPSQATRLPFTPAEGLKQIQHLQAYPGGALWRDCADYVTAHESARWFLLEGTGLWLINHAHFRRWLIGERIANTLFCPGEPGSGKTILTSLAIDEVQKWQENNRSSNIGLAYFYFSYRRPIPMRNVVLALLHQLYLQSLSPVDELTALEILAAKSEHIPFASVVSVLLTVSRQFSKVYIILDALDECAPGYKPDLLHLLKSIKDSPARLLASSRPHQTFGVLEVGPKIEILPPKGDIEHYARTKLQHTPLFAGDDELLDEVISALVAASERHHISHMLLRFLPIALQVDAILEKHTKEKVREQKAELQRSPYSAYQDGLNRIQNQEPYMTALAKRTLTWLFYSQRPLETAELLEIHHSSTQGATEIDVPLIVEACMTLVRAGETIAFTHISVKEFLEKQTRTAIEKQTRTAIDDENMIAVHCLQYLIDSNIDEATTHDSLNDQLRNNPFLDYAATYWGCHLRNVVQKDEEGYEKLRQLCSMLLNDKSRVASLCHIIFMSQLEKKAPTGKLVKSSWLHLVSYFGLDWAINPPLFEETMADEQDEWGRTPLHLAALNGFVDCVTILLTEESQSQQDLDQKTVWHYAAMSGNLETIRCLADFNPRILESSHSDTFLSLREDKMNKSPLEYAATNGDERTFKMLLPFYTSKSANDFRSRAFRAALAGGKLDILKCLLSQGEVINYNYLLEATKTGLEAAVRLLVDYGSRIDNPDATGESALTIAAREGWNRILKFLIWNAANLESKDADGQTALALAVKTGNEEGVQILLQAGAWPESSINNEPLVVYAASQGRVEIVRLLLYAGVEPYEAALAAVKNGRAEVLEQLFQHRLLDELSSKDRHRLVEAATEAAQSSILDMLESHGLNVSPLPVYSVQPEVEVDPEASFQKVETWSEAPIQLSKAPSETDLVSTKGLEESALKHARDIIGARGRLIEQSLKLSELETKKVRPPSISSHQTPQDESRLVRSSGLSNIAMPFLLLSEPITAGSLGLGSIVANAKDPLCAYAPSNTSTLSELVEENRYESIQTDYQSVQERNSTSRFALEVLRPVLNLEAAQTRVAAIASPRVARLQLKNHEQVLSRILSNSMIREEIFTMAKAMERKELFIVVGMLTATDLLTSIKRESWAAGTASPSSGRAARSESSEVKHTGDKIFAISYRVIKIRTSRSLRNIATRGSLAPVTDVFVDNYFSPNAHERLL